MYVKLMVAATALVMALAATPGAMAESSGPDKTCAVEDLACYCADPSSKGCGGLTGQKNCQYSAGPTPGIQVGLLCEFNLTLPGGVA